MVNVKKQKNEELDRAGRAILKAAVASENEVELAASAPFQFRRVLAAIAEERRRREDSGSWLSLIFVARRAVPAMALIAIIAALIMIWSAWVGVAPVNNQADAEALFGPPEPGVEQTVLASRNGLTRDEVFNIIVDRNYGVNSR